MLESNSAASVSPSLKFQMENGTTFTFNFQMDGRLTVIGAGEEEAVTGVFEPEQVENLKDALAEFVKKRTGK